MTQEDINEVVTKSMPQWKKDQFDAIHANADYIDWLRRKIERLEEKLKSHNKDYAKCLSEIMYEVRTKAYPEACIETILKEHFA